MEEEITDERYEALRKDLSALLNKYSQENRSDTPDFMLADFMLGCLNVYENTIVARENWYGRKLTRDTEQALPPQEVETNK